MSCIRREGVREKVVVVVVVGVGVGGVVYWGLEQMGERGEKEQKAGTGIRDKWG